MTVPDMINGSFEFLGAPFILLSIVRLLKEKSTKGINFLTPAFFFAWGLWNLYYYPHLGQWCSFIGGVAIALCNLWWVWLLVYYSRCYCPDCRVKLRKFDTYGGWECEHACPKCGRIR